MSTRHIVRISPLHTSILLTVIYSLVAFFFTVITWTFAAIQDVGGSFFKTLVRFDVESVVAEILLKMVLVFIVALVVSMLYNFLAQYLGGIEITLDDD